MKLELVAGWKQLWKAWSVQLAALGIFLPELLQLVADSTGSLDWMDAGYKSGIRLACLVGIIFLRPVKQIVVTPEAPQ